MPFAGTVYIDASVDLLNTSTTKPSETDCDVAIGPDQAHLQEIGRPFFADLPKVTADNSGFGALVDETLPITRSIDMPAGAYDIGIRCQNVSNTGAPEVYEAALERVRDARGELSRAGGSAGLSPRTPAGTPRTAAGGPPRRGGS